MRTSSTFSTTGSTAGSTNHVLPQNKTNNTTHMSREINTHKVNPANDTIGIFVTDTPGAGGANHHYELQGFNTATNPSQNLPAGMETQQIILFQNGPIPEAGVNGLTGEVLLALVKDRLESFQAGPYACEENGKALAAVNEALHWLLFRTLKRMARGVEGSHTK